jgi:phosphate uptake regulator
MGKDIEEERLNDLYNEIFEDYKWYKGGIEEGDEHVDEYFKSLIRNIKLLLREIRRRNERLDDYPRLIEIIKDLFNNYV